MNIKDNKSIVHVCVCVSECTIITFLSKQPLLSRERVSMEDPEFYVFHATGHEFRGRVGVELDIKDAIAVASCGCYDLATPPVPDVEGVVIIKTNRRQVLERQ